MFQSRKGGFAVFKGGKAFERVTGANIEDATDLSDAMALYIWDGQPPVAATGAFRLVITSPKKRNWHEFFKSGNARL